MNEMKLFVKLASKRPGKCNYAYIDTAENTGNIMRKHGITGKILHKLRASMNSELAIVVVQFAKKKENEFLLAMAAHKRDSILLGWGNTVECKKMVADMMNASR